MSRSTWPGSRTDESPDTGPRLTPERLRGFFVDLAIVLAAFAALGVLGAVLWNQLVDPPRFTVTDQGGSMGELQLTRYVGIDGWFGVIALVFGIAAGVGLLLLRSDEPVEMVVLVVLGGAFASFLMLKVGLALGPGDPRDALRHAVAGADIPVQLKPQAKGVELAWPIGAALGALAILLFVNPRPRPAEQEH
jgi:hypothetical protein